MVAVPIISLVDLNGDGDKTDLGVMMPVILIKKNPAGLNLTESIFDY